MKILHKFKEKEVQEEEEEIEGGGSERRIDKETRTK